MQHTYRVLFEPTKSHTKKAIRAIVAEFPEVELDRSIGEIATSTNEEWARLLLRQARESGFKCILTVETWYTREDVLKGEFGILKLGPAESTAFRATLPKDAFDLKTGCKRCGVGATMIKPHVLTEGSIECSANFNYGAEGTSIVLMKSRIAQEIIEATGQPECMRHPVTRTGKVVKEWMEPVALATMPPLSRKSSGLSFGSTSASARIGEPPETVEPCLECGREIWDYDREHHPRFVYSGDAAGAAKEFAVVAMHEPHQGFPGLDPKRETFKHLYGLPWLLFNHKAVEVLVRYTQIEHIRGSAFVEPVYLEGEPRRTRATRSGGGET